MGSAVIASQQTDASDLSRLWPQPRLMSASFLQTASELKIISGSREGKTVGGKPSGALVGGWPELEGKLEHIEILWVREGKLSPTLPWG